MEIIVKLEGRTINNELKLIKYLGEGAAGEVYAASVLKPLSKLKTSNSVAVKIYKPQILDYPNQEERIQREFYIGSKLCHKNIVEIYYLNYTTIDGVHRPFLVMELLKGETLTKHIESKHPLQLRQIKTFFNQLCSATNFMHKADSIHRDIKPDNIMVIEDGKRLKLMDFGVAKHSSFHTITKADSFLGTIRYAAPEYLFDLKATEKSDAYAVGVILYFMIYGFEIFKDVEVFSNLVVSIRDQEPVFTYPVRRASKEIIILIEITRQLMTKDRSTRLPLEKAKNELNASYTGDIWRKKIVPETKNMSIVRWPPDAIGLDSEIAEMEVFLTEKYFSTIVDNSTARQFLDLYFGKDKFATIASIRGINKIIDIRAIGLEQDKWKKRFANVKLDYDKQISLLRALLLTFIIEKPLNHYEFEQTLDWALKQPRPFSHELDEVCKRAKLISKLLKPHSPTSQR